MITKFARASTIDSVLAEVFACGFCDNSAGNRMAKSSNKHARGADRALQGFLYQLWSGQNFMQQSLTLPAAASARLKSDFEVINQPGIAKIGGQQNHQRFIMAGGQLQIFPVTNMQVIGAKTSIA